MYDQYTTQPASTEKRIPTRREVRAIATAIIGVTIKVNSFIEHIFVDAEKDSSLRKGFSGTSFGTPVLVSSDGYADENEEPDELFSPGMSLHEAEARCLGATRYPESFAGTALELTSPSRFVAEDFDIRSLVGESLAPEFVGNVITPDVPVYIKAERESLRTLIMLASSVLTHWGRNVQ